jgi:hypothetical protein
MDLKASLLLHCAVVVKRMSVLSAYMGNVFQAKMTSLSKLILFFGDTEKLMFRFGFDFISNKKSKLCIKKSKRCIKMES